MVTLVRVILAAVLLTSAWTVATAAELGDDFRKLCVATHADAPTVFRLTDAQGWGPAPYSSDFVQMSGNPDGREIDKGLPGFRVITASKPGGATKPKTCVMMTQAVFDEVIADLQKTYGPPSDLGSKVATWRMIVASAKLEQLKSLSDPEFSQRSAHQPLGTITLTKSDTAGYVILRYTEDSLLVRPDTSAGASPASARFKVWIEQGGRRMPMTASIRLSRAPFTIVFEGNRALAYSVVASLDGRDIGDRPEQIVDRFSIGAESDSHDLLFVNGARRTADQTLTNHFWDNGERGAGRQFQSYTVAGGGLATARREVRTFVLDDGEQDPVNQWTGATIHLLVVGRLGGDTGSFVDPKYLVIAFQ